MRSVLTALNFLLYRVVAPGLLLALACAGCSSTPGKDSSATGAQPLVPALQTRAYSTSTSIKHVIVIIQENRSLDNIFAGFPGADAPTFGRTHTGQIVPLRPVTFKSTDVGHSWWNAHTDWDHGRMDGFDLVTPYSGAAQLLPYSYLQRSEVAPYWSMARQYVLADHMFPTEFGPSFTAHLDLVAGTTQVTSSEYVMNNPSTGTWGCDAAAGTFTLLVSSTGVESSNGPFPCFTQFQTMADTLDAAGVSWKYYAPAIGTSGGNLWSVFDAISNVRYGSDWQSRVISPQTTVLTDIQNGVLPEVSWVVPDATDSDHASSNSDSGPSWVSSIVNAVGQSQYWNSSAVIVLWDDWGGWYDDLPPPQEDAVGLGIRVPCIIVSPYARRHYVSHTQYEFGSVLKFIEGVFGLPSLGYTDARANSIADSFDFAVPARRFATINAPYSMTHFLRERPSHKRPDDE